MKLLFEQRIDNGVALMPVKLVVDDEIEARVRGFIPDPLDVIFREPSLWRPLSARSSISLSQHFDQHLRSGRGVTSSN